MVAGPALAQKQDFSVPPTIGMKYPQTFFQIPHQDDEDGAEEENLNEPAPATCPLPTEGWWSAAGGRGSKFGSSFFAIPTEETPEASSPSPPIVTPVPPGPNVTTPDWSDPDPGANFLLGDGQACEIGPTPDWFGPTPSPGITKSAASALPGLGGGGHFASLLTAAAAEEELAPEEGLPTPVLPQLNQRSKVPPPPPPSFQPPPQPQFQPSMRQPQQQQPPQLSQQPPPPPHHLEHWQTGGGLPGAGPGAGGRLVGLSTEPPRLGGGSSSNKVRKDVLATAPVQVPPQPMAGPLATQPRIPQAPLPQTHLGSYGGSHVPPPTLPTVDPWGASRVMIQLASEFPTPPHTRHEAASSSAAPVSARDYEREWDVGSPGSTECTYYSQGRGEGAGGGAGGASVLSSPASASGKVRRRRGGKECKDPDRTAEDPYDWLPLDTYIDLSGLVRVPVSDTDPVPSC